MGFLIQHFVLVLSSYFFPFSTLSKLTDLHCGFVEDTHSLAAYKMSISILNAYINSVPVPFMTSSLLTGEMNCLHTLII